VQCSGLTKRINHGVATGPAAGHGDKRAAIMCVVSFFIAVY